MKKSIKTQILEGARSIIPLTPSFLVAILLRLAIKQRKPNGKNTIFYSKTSNKFTLLALDSERYRGDIDILAKSENFRVLHIKQGWERLLTEVYLNGIEIDSILEAHNDVELSDKHKKTQLLITKILSKLYKIIDIDCVTTVHFKYLPDHYWTLVSENLNIPYIMLYRECNLMSPYIYNKVLFLMMRFKTFHGSHVIVHNKKCKDVFIEANFFEERKITIASALRMDYLVNNINQRNNNNLTQEKKRKKFTLFYFPIDSSMFGARRRTIGDQTYYSDSWWSERERFFSQLHNVILKLAKENKDIDFIIKPKEIFMHEKSWNFYEKVIADSDIDIKKLNNYIVDASADTHNLISDSSIICGGQSSTTVESLVLGKRFILPAFCGYTSTEYFKQFPWRKHLNLFDVATNTTEFENIFYDAVQSSGINDNVIEKRRELYLQCFDDFSGNAIDKYTKTIVDVINQRRGLDK